MHASLITTVIVNLAHRIEIYRTPRIPIIGESGSSWNSASECEPFTLQLGSLKEMKGGGGAGITAWTEDSLLSGNVLVSRFNDVSQDLGDFEVKLLVLPH